MEGEGAEDGGEGTLGRRDVCYTLVCTGLSTAWRTETGKAETERGPGRRVPKKGEDGPWRREKTGGSGRESERQGGPRPPQNLLPRLLSLNSV